MIFRQRGDRVVATRDIGGILRARVPRGTRGVIVNTPLLGSMRVMFTIQGWTGNRAVEVDVTEDEIA